MNVLAVQVVAAAQPQFIPSESRSKQDDVMQTKTMIVKIKTNNVVNQISFQISDTYYTLVPWML